MWWRHLLVCQPVRCADELHTVVEKTSELQQRKPASALRPQPENISAFIVRRFRNLSVRQAAMKFGLNT
jgi:hypothetical protein